MEMVLDIVALLDRINKLENETKELRGLAAQNKKDADGEIQRTQEMIWEQQPKLRDDKLVFETADQQGNTVYGFVIVNEVSEQAVN